MTYITVKKEGESMFDKENFRKKVGKNIKELREEKGITQKSLANKTGIHSNTIFGYEAGKNIPSLDAAYKIANYFGIPIDFLIGEHKISLSLFNAGQTIYYIDRNTESLEKVIIDHIEIYAMRTLLVCKFSDRRIINIDAKMYKKSFYINEKEAIFAMYRLYNKKG